MLQGESLLNDATGVVAFQFAIAAAVTGAFSLFDASVSFSMSFFGGILAGILIAFALHYVQGKVRDLGLESTTFHVLYDVLTPFMVYLFSEVIGVSGILAVVSAGIVLSSFSERRIGPSVSRLNIVSSSVWRVLSFFINGLVFVLLGMQLPRALQSSWDDVVIDNFSLIGYVLVITLIIVLVRFAWIAAGNRLSRSRRARRRQLGMRERIRTDLVTTMGGPKGAVTLSVIFSIPVLMADGSAFPQRNLMIFIASGVILCTLLLANFLLPVLAPNPHAAQKSDFEKHASERVEIMRMVIAKLSAQQTESNVRSTQAVIKSYKDRIERIQTMSDMEPLSKVKLRTEVIKYQQKFVASLIEVDQVDEVVGYQYIQRLTQASKLLLRDRHASRSLRSPQNLRIAMRIFARMARESIPSVEMNDRNEALRDLMIRSEAAAIGFIQGMYDNPDYPNEVVSDVLLSHENTLRTLESAWPSITAIARTNDSFGDIQRIALRFELEAIQDMYDEGRLPLGVAKSMRDNVYLMQMDIEDHI